MSRDFPNTRFRTVRKSTGATSSPAAEIPSPPFGDFPLITFPGYPQLPPLKLEIPGVISTGRKIVPDEEHPFIAPGPTDQRGGCPGLNLLANYGYISRDGITNSGELLWAMQEALGYSPDSAGLLVALAFRGMTDITTLKMSIGRTDSRTSGPLVELFGQAPGAFSPASHTKYEIDGSMAVRVLSFDDEFFVADGFGGQANATKWKELVELAEKDFGGVMGLAFNAEVRYQRYLECVANNPECSWLPTGQAFFYSAETQIYSTIPSGSLDGSASSTQNDLATPEVVSTFFGFQRNDDGTYTKVHEKLPPSADGNWYRRAIPLTGTELSYGLAGSYMAHPVVFGSNDGTTNSFIASSDQEHVAFSDPTGKAAMCLVIDSVRIIFVSPIYPTSKYFSPLQLIENIPIAALNLQVQILGLLDVLLAPARATLNC
ncbi:unspecific peroxygenase, partial [Phenoliferia sp. Uapishka_3]